MTGKNISNSVNRAFRIFGALFIFGGFFLGFLLWYDTPVFLSVTGVIGEIRIEKERPMGFEEIPVDTPDPQYKNTPININTFAIVDYTFQNKSYSAELVSWNEEVTWQTGDTIPLYFHESEPEYPTYHIYENDSNGKIISILAGLVMSLAGFIFFLMGTLQKRKDKKNKEQLMDSIDRIKIPYSMGKISVNNSVLHDEKNKGNYFMGGILTTLGLILLLVMVPELIAGEEMMNRLLAVFPIFLSFGLLYMGISDFYSDRIIVTGTDVRLIHKALWGRFDRSEPLRSFGGIKEIKLEKQVSGSMKRHIYREQVLVHRDSRFHEISMKLIPDNAKAVGEARLLSVSLNLPRLLFDREKLFLEYPDGKIVKNRDQNWDPQSTVDPSKPFPGKYLKILDNSTSHLLIIRSYKKSLIWSFVIIALGVGLFIGTGAGAVLFPFLMMGLIFGVLGMKGDRLEVLNGNLIIEKFWFNKPSGTKKIHLNQLENVIIGNDTIMNNAECLEIIGKGERLYFGQSAKLEELRWIQARLIEMKSMYYN